MPAVEAAVQTHDRVSPDGQISCGDQADVSGITVQDNMRRECTVICLETGKKTGKLINNVFPVLPDGTGDMIFAVILPAAEIHQKKSGHFQIAG